MLQRLLIATFTETLQQYKEDFSSLLQHMADCYKALLADKLCCASTSVAIVHPVNECKSIIHLSGSHCSLLCEFCNV